MDVKLITYVNSVMDEFNELGSDLYESMIDMDREVVRDTAIKLKKLLSDIQRSYHDE